MVQLAPRVPRQWTVLRDATLRAALRTRRVASRRRPDAIQSDLFAGCRGKNLELAKVCAQGECAVIELEAARDAVLIKVERQRIFGRGVARSAPKRFAYRRRGSSLPFR